MNYFLNWQEHTGSQPEKFYKTTLWQGEHVTSTCLGSFARSERQDGPAIWRPLPSWKR